MNISINKAQLKRRFGGKDGHLLITCDIDSLVNVLRRWFEEFRSIYVVAEEYGATDAAAACCIDATVPQKPEFLVTFVMGLQKTGKQLICVNSKLLRR